MTSVKLKILKIPCRFSLSFFPVSWDGDVNPPICIHKPIGFHISCGAVTEPVFDVATTITECVLSFLTSIRNESLQSSGIECLSPLSFIYNECLHPA